MSRKTEVTQEIPEIHDLFTREIRPIHNWCEWLSRWQAAATIEEMLGLLHTGFKVRIDKWEGEEIEYCLVDRIIFYFKIADGWARYGLLERPEDERKSYLVGRDGLGNRIEKNPGELRRNLAQKAFDVLSQEFPKNYPSLQENSRNGDNGIRRWDKLIESEKLFLVIQNFFRVENQYQETIIRNLSGHKERSNNENQMISFLLNLARFIWSWKEYRVEEWRKDEEKKRAQNYNAIMRTNLDQAKPWMIEILQWLGEIGLLKKHLLDLDRVSLSKLKEIAMRTILKEHRHPVPKDRRVANLDEACFAGSRAAWMLKERELNLTEHKRLKGIQKTVERMERDAERIKSLSAAK